MTADCQTIEPKILWTVGDICHALSISRSSFFSLRSAGRIPLTPIRLSTKLLYRAEEVRAWVAQNCPAAERWIQLQGASR